MRFEIFDHTADVGIKAYGKSYNEMLENAAYGMFSLIANLDDVKDLGEFKVVLKASDKEQLLVDWLSELLYIHEVYNVLLDVFKVEVVESGEELELKGAVKGEAIDEKRHDLKMMVKAVTYHTLEINEERGYLFVLFDV